MQAGATRKYVENGEIPKLLKDSNSALIQEKRTIDKPLGAPPEIANYTEGESEEYRPAPVKG